MKTLQTINAGPEKCFTVAKEEINDNNTLLADVLYMQMENFVKSIIMGNINIANSSPQLLKLQILKNAYLKDRLHMRAKIKSLKDS